MKTDVSFLHISAFTLLGIAIIVGFYMGRVSQRIGLPSLIGYMIFGVILGPSILNLVDGQMIQRLSFLTEIVLGFVAFIIGSELSLSSLKRLGSSIIAIIFAESLGAFFAVLIAVYLLTGDLPLAILFGALAPASAPAGTVAVIQENRAKGPLTKALYAVVGFDDGLAVIIFGFGVAIAKRFVIEEASMASAGVLEALWPPFMEIGLSLFTGGIIGLLLCKLVLKLQKSQDILTIIFGVILLAIGLSNLWHLSLILTNMMIGFVIVNSRREALVQRVTRPVMKIMPLMFLLFFSLAGANVQISAIPALGTLGGAYILARSMGKFCGVQLGGLIGRVEKKVRRYLGFGILSQAGVAIGLALIVKNDFFYLDAQYHIPHAATIGNTVLTSITATCIFFEIIGPILAKFALKRAGEIQ
ncbi:MAG: cation:proton antiporter [Desulfatiglans sp.]|jgi:Kef-type K+ transport system membrane component KefB|nr:cation:proton antiporter [Thermodesulfobacteriota bacterium]MEE4351643.1 cation:proton antiporter [Desulfatiglans sp.]